MKKIIQTDLAPKAIGPYSQAVQVGNILFMSGQIGIEPETGIMPDSLSDQVDQVMKNITNVVEKAGGDLSSIVKTTIFLLDMDDFSEFNQVYEKYFLEDPPARSCVEATLPKNALVEIEAIAIISNKKD